MRVRGVRGPVARFVAVVLVGGAFAAGCTSSPSVEPAAEEKRAEPTTSAPAEPASVTLSVPRGAQHVEPGKLVTASAEHAAITKASLVGAHGTVVSGEVRDDGASWSATEPLGYGKTYTLSVSAKGEDGETVEKKSTFTTATPAAEVSVYPNVQPGQRVGVGMPLVFTFSSDIVDKKAAERALRITTEPRTEGAFHWFSDSEVTWRPKEYWRSGTTISVDAAIYGKHLGGGLYGAQDEHATVNVGKKVVAIADGGTHHMRVFVDDKMVRRMPISMGKPSSSTPNGTYTVMSEHNGYTMDSSTYGVPTDSSAGYEIWVETAARLSYSGIFYHSAPWSVGYQGNTNTSHGCINLAPEDAAWLMSHSQPGDLFRVQNGGEQVLEPTDGWSVWQMSWRDWLAG